MKNLKLFPKTFLVSIGLFAVLIILVHALVYTLMPQFYLQQKEREAAENLTALTTELRGKSTEEMRRLSREFAQMKNVNITLTIDGRDQYFQGFQSINIVTDSGKSVDASVVKIADGQTIREMANALYLAGFDVKDVHTTDLISGRETLEDVQFIGAVGGFSNSDVLGSAKGWAGALLYNEQAKKALDNFFARPDTLSVGICNGCQLFMELEVINPEHTEHGKMWHNDSGKHESGFVSVTIPENNSVMLSTLAGSTLGVWISHGEGKFHLPLAEAEYNIVGKYAYQEYPANPNGSDYNTAMLCDKTGRHLVTMPHIERSVFPWQWAYYPSEKTAVSPWLEAFINAREWIEARNAK